MFQHILFPTDGAPASDAALQACLRFAHDSGARITAVHVLPEFHVLTYHTQMLEDTRAEYLKQTEATGQKLLAQVVAAAREQRVPCSQDLRRSDQIHAAILSAAAEHGCDLIAMASHGYRGLKGVLLGSETQKVLVHSPLPVLVLRHG